MRNAVTSAVAAALVAAVVAAPAAASTPQSTSLLNGSGAQVGNVSPDSPLGTWIPAATAPTGVVRYAHAQCSGQNTFYIISGVAAGGSIVTANQRYDATTNTWTAMAPIPIGSEGPGGVCLNGKIYVAGGGVGGVGTTNFFIYDITANTWAVGPPLPAPNALAQMGASNGKVYVIGGDADFTPASGVLNTVNVFDVATNTWLANGATMPTATSAAGYAQIGTFVYIAGGWGVSAPGTNANQTQRYDMATNTWTAGPTFTAARADGALAATNSAIYAIGGDANGGGFFDLSAAVDRLDVSAWPAGTWAATDSLPSARSAHRGGFCTNAFVPAAGEVWSTGGIAAPFPTFTGTNQYLAAEACIAVATAAPAALTVNPTPAGNGVLEPNEPAVVVAPEWSNTGNLAIASLTGVASNFTGPAGATYTINDSTADYGALAVGQQKSCLTTGNCYTVTVTAPTRPITHWDSTFRETVAPLGTTKDWTLHIGNSFTDVTTSNPFYRFVETILHKNVTTGCGTGVYCPSASTTRAQMAVFVLVAREPAGFNPPACVAGSEVFSDVPASSPFCRWVEELFRRGVVSGCGNGQFCATNPAARDTMAVFVLRTLLSTLDPPPCVPGSEMFADLPASSPFCRWVEELVRRGVVTGCGGGNYCPTVAVTREQMAVFLTVTFGLTLYGL